MALLIKAAKDAGLNANFYTYYAGAAGTPTVIGNAMEGKIKVVYGSYVNLPGDHQKVQDEFRAKFKEDYSMTTAYHLFKVLPAAMAKAKSTDPVKVALAMEGLTVKSFNGDVTMRKADHQLQQTLYQFTWRKKDAKNPYDVENTGMSWVLERTFEPYVSSTPTSCNMKRPSGGA
jgi:branched-chain amino acid transport system substrate-binding protein